jgi:hypothetical protein
MSASSNALAGRASTAGRAAVDTEPAAGKTAVLAVTDDLLATVSAGNAAVATARVANVTCLAVAGSVAVPEGM